MQHLKKAIEPNFYKHRNNDGMTAKELFALNKEALHDKSQEWLNSMAQNFIIISVLITTLAFTAAYTVPGGSKSDGSPVLLNQPLFIVFAFGDVVSLTFSLATILIFLSILTSSFELQEFMLALPQKVMLGITCLLYSMIMMMLAFSATIILMIHKNEQYWTKIILYTVVLLPVTVLTIVYLPLFLASGKTFEYSLKRIRSFFPEKVNQTLGEKSNIGADVPVAYTTTAENSHPLCLSLRKTFNNTLEKLRSFFPWSWSNSKNIDRNIGADVPVVNVGKNYLPLEPFMIN